MLDIISHLVSLFLSLLKSRKQLIIHNAVLSHQLLILKRSTNPPRRFTFSRISKLLFVILNRICPIQQSLHLVSPATVLSWQRRLTASFWTFLSSDSHPGRPPVPAWIKDIILSMKNENLLWGAKRIRDELSLKLGITLDKKTIQKIINNFRRKGKIAKTLSWSAFLSTNVKSLLATDFLTIDTILNKRFYVIFFISIETREIIRFAITESPSATFVKQQLLEIESSFSQFKHLIHDNSPQFLIDYGLFGFKGVAITSYSPNMNSFAERFVRSIRSEALDFHILLHQKQVFSVISEYVRYYNSLRPHQGINAIPNGPPPRSIPVSQLSIIRKTSILGGLHHQYFAEEVA